MALQLDRMAELDAALAGGALLLVPNYRSSDQLVDQLCRLRRSARAQTPTLRPAIRAIDLWLADLWRELACLHNAEVLHRRVLQPAEEHLLWQRLIRRASPELLLLNQEGSATAAASAWRLLQQWQVPLATVRRHLAPAEESAQRDDREYAFTWLQAFDRHCRREGLLTFSGMVQELVGFIADGTLTRLQLLPPAVLRAGFDAPPPLYRGLFAALEAQGVKLADWQFSVHLPAMAQQVCGRPADECLAAALWAKDVLERDPGASIGILTADSRMLKGGLERCFAQVFAAQPHVFSTTLAGTLADTPFAQTALGVLAIFDSDIDTLQCCALLRSPWLLAATGEQDARAELELRLRRSRSLSVSTAELRERCLDAARPWHCPQLGAALRMLRQDFLRQPRRQSLQAWLQFLEQCWDMLLPRSTLLQSGDRALVKAWEGMLKHAGGSSALFGDCDFAETRSLLARFCRASMLASGQSQTPILLLTPAATAGLHFTHLWCLQMSDELWPAEEELHPYLPLTLQREHAMPGSERASALARAGELLQGLIARTTHEIVFSHAQSADDLPQRQTALVAAGLEQRPPLPARMAALHAALELPERSPLEILADATQVPLLDDTVVKGGVGLVASQSACPFKAFAQYRLQARELPRPQYGVPAQALGDCLHEALRAFWTGMQSQAALLAADETTLQNAVRSALAPALVRLARLYPQVMTPTMQELETERLTGLMLQWLEIERQRGPFSVLVSEQELVWSLPRLQLGLRVDRIDRHADGSTVVIDYKSGRTAAVRWDEDRPAAPQLLLYQQVLDDSGRYAETSALLYASLNVETLGYSGVAADDSVYPGLGLAPQADASADWPALKRRWREVIGLLAGEFLDGYAAVQPARRNSCDHCHLGSLCRIAELRGETEEPA